MPDIASAAAPDIVLPPPRILGGLFLPDALRQRRGSRGFSERELPMQLRLPSNLSWTVDGFIAQNVYLFCASFGLAAVVRGLVGRRAPASAMGLWPRQCMLLAQSVGYPA